MRNRKFKTPFKAIVGLIMILSYSCSLIGQSFKILYLNNPEIKINGLKAQPKMVFEETDNIQWVTDSDAMRVLDLSKNKPAVLSSAEFKETKTNNIKAFKHAKDLATRELGNDILAETKKYQLLDTLYLEAGKLSGENVRNHLLIKEEETAKRYDIKRSPDQAYFLIPRSIISEITSETIAIDLIESDGDWEYPVYKDLIIEILPE